MFTEFLLETFKNNRDADFIAWKKQAFNYRWLLERFYYWKRFLDEEKILTGATTALEADFTPNSIALFLALVDRGCILVPLTQSIAAKKDEFKEIAQCEIAIQVDERDEVVVERLSHTVDHSLYLELRETGHPGLVLFSSGSTGTSKAVLHDLSGILEKYRIPRHRVKTITFLLFDHIGGVNTMFYQLANAGCIVTVQDRKPDAVLKVIEEEKVELLPTSPTFINLILLSESYKQFDLSSLRTITYGTEPMPESVLKRFHELYPDIRLLQTYGLSEIGILRSKSESSDSLWVKVGGDEFQTRIVDGILQVKTQSAMLGYLNANAESPFTEDGWFITGDQVEVKGEYLRFLGRKSEIINVGGEKVYPTEVESVIQEMQNVAEVNVYGEKNAIMGNIVRADIIPRETVSFSNSKDKRAFIAEIQRFCRSRLQPFKVPARIKLIDGTFSGERFKKMKPKRDADLN